MEPAMDLAQPPARHVGVYFRRADIGVTEKFLDYSQVGTMFEQVCCEAMSQHMRRNVARNPGAPHALLNSEPQSDRGKWSPPFGEKHGAR